MGDQTPLKDGGGSGEKYTLPGRRPGADAGASEGAVVVHVSWRGMNVPVQCPMLMETNYSLWALKMKIIMWPLRVWSAAVGDGDYDEAKDKGAFGALSRSVPDSVMKEIAEYKTARRHVGEDRVKKTCVKQLKWQLDKMEMNDG